MIRFALAFASLAGAAQADAFCDALSDLGTVETGPILTFPNTNDRAECQTALMLGGGIAVHCGWAFDYRALAAQTAFEDVIDAVTDCLGPRAQAVQDQDVNHPDFYDLKTFTAEDHTISVSLKDKGALQQTLVFVRVQRR